MKTITRRDAIIGVLTWLVGSSGLCAAPLVGDFKPGKVHTFTWQGNDGTPDDKREPVFEFDGEKFSAERVVTFKVPAMRLPEGAVVDVVFPEDAKIHDPEFIIPLNQCGLVHEWRKMGVKVNYYHRGSLISRDELVLRFAEGCIKSECAEVSLNGLKMGTGEAAFTALCTRVWKVDGFLTVRFIHEYPLYPSLPTFALPSELWDVLDKARVKCDIASEFLGVKDAWQTADKVFPRRVQQAK